MHRVLLAVTVAASAIVLAGCGSSKNSGGCSDVPVGINNEVASSLSTGFTVTDFKAVRSGDKKVWFVAGRGNDPSGNVIYPTWAIDKLSNSGGLKTVDATSRQVTPAIERMQGVSAEDVAAQKARDCAKKIKPPS